MKVYSGFGLSRCLFEDASNTPLRRFLTQSSEGGGVLGHDFLGFEKCFVLATRLMMMCFGIALR